MHGLNFSYYLRHLGIVTHFFFSGMSVVEGLDILPVGIVCMRVTQEY